jgi:uncharacterized protein (DUF1499 family)
MRRHIPEEPVSIAAVWSRRLAVFAATVGLLAIALARLNVVDPPSALAILGGAIAVALASLLLFFAASAIIWRTGRRGLGQALGGLVISLLTLGYPSYLAFEAVRLPLLADISTDPADPPRFSLSKTATAARSGYTPTGGLSSARQEQQGAYADVEPIVVDLDADEAFALVLKTAAARGWKVIEQHPPGGRSGEGHVDFLDRTLVLGFYDDVTVRLRPLAGQTRIDVRSASRYGRHDFGANAKRIQQFAEELQAQLDARS